MVALMGGNHVVRGFVYAMEVDALAYMTGAGATRGP
jgi:hypothetical protein